MSRASHTHHEPHAAATAGRLNWLRAAVLGSNDGIISLAALLVGVAATPVSNHILLLTGVAGILAGAFSMAVGEYVSVSSQRDTEQALLAKERYELEHFHEDELQELAGLYEQKGLAPETARKVAEELTAHDAFAAHAEAELRIDPQNLTDPVQAAIASAISFSAGGAIPLIALLLPAPALRIPVTFAAVFIALIITGFGSARASGARTWPVMLRIVLGGIFAMACTFGIGRLLDVSVA